MKKKIKLDSFESEIEKDADKLVPVSEREEKRIRSIIERARKNISISLRINNYDLEKIKKKADNDGLPYQTLITRVLHKYVNEEFFEKDEVLKTFRALKKVG